MPYDGSKFVQEEARKPVRLEQSGGKGVVGKRQEDEVGRRYTMWGLWAMERAQYACLEQILIVISKYQGKFS